MKFRKVFILMPIALVFAPAAFASWFHPQLSLLGSYAQAQNYSEITSGVFDIHNRKINFVLEFTNKFYLRHSFFIEGGIRYNQYKTFINGLNQIEGHFDNPYPLSWTKGYESVVIPVRFGKELFHSKKNKAELYLGISSGILMTSFSKIEVSSDFPRNINNNDEIRGTISDSQNDLPSFLYLSADIGASYQPIQSIPNFSIGFLCSFQLTQTKPYNYHGVITNLTQNREYVYDMQHHQRFINYALTLSYTFGKHKPGSSKTNSLNCSQ